MFRLPVLAAVFLTAVSVAPLAGCARPALTARSASPALPDEPSPSQSQPETVTVSGAEYRLTGPYTHEGLAVFLLHSDRKDETDYVTLDEGLKSGKVKVTEKGDGEVAELLLFNLDRRPLFLQEGDRLDGGKQDRTLHTSLVVPPGTRKMPVPTFCIEPDRWQAGEAGRAFAYADTAALAPRSVRYAAKVEQDQGRVWSNVAREKARAASDMRALNLSSSLNETFDSEPVRKATEGYSRALGDLAQRHRDAVGVAIAVGGRVEEVNIYPGNRLLRKMYPRLIEAYVVDASAATKEGAAKPARRDEVARFTREGSGEGRRKETVAGGAELSVEEMGDRAGMVTSFKGDTVHRQFMRKGEEPAAEGEGRPQSPPRNSPGPR